MAQQQYQQSPREEQILIRPTSLLESSLDLDNNASIVQNIKVAVRVRPLLEHELTGNDVDNKQRRLIADVVNNTITVMPEDQQSNSRQYKFDQVFDTTCSQQEVYKGLGISSMIKKVVEGYHATIFAYGQTGSGKTFTMEGTANAQGNNLKAKDYSNHTGLTQRAIIDLFRQVKRIKEANSKHAIVYCSFLQIYNEHVYDLLNPDYAPELLRGGQNYISDDQQQQLSGTKNSFNHHKNLEQRPALQQGLRIRWSKKEQFIVENLFVFECTSAEDAMELFQQGLRNKVVAAHNLNHQSSRSHCIFTLTVETVDPANLDTVVTSKLQLVDLAGSEKIMATTQTMAKESIDINKSLFVLRKVINRLSDISTKKIDLQKCHVPYRDSKLTSLLQQSLGGNSYCLMVACISPAEKYLDGFNGSGETISTLNYATRAACICNQPTKNIDPKIKIILQLQSKVERLQRELKNANELIAYLSDQQCSNGPPHLNQLQLIDQVLQKRNIIANAPSQLPQQNVPRKSMISNVQPIIQDHPPQLSTSQSFMQNKLQTYKHQISLANDRLIDSVAKVTELLRANQMLREEVDTLSRNNDGKDYEIYSLNQENQKLRERIDILENLVGVECHRQLSNIKGQKGLTHSASGKDIGNNAKDNQERLQRGISATKEINSSFQDDGALDKVYNELINLRQQNRILEKRVKTLEKQNVEISKSLEFVGNNEPTRPVMVNNSSHYHDSNEQQRGHLQSSQGKKHRVFRYSEDNSIQFSPSTGDLLSNSGHHPMSPSNEYNSRCSSNPTKNRITSLRQSTQFQNQLTTRVGGSSRQTGLNKNPSTQVIETQYQQPSFVSGGTHTAMTSDRRSQQNSRKKFLQRLGGGYADGCSYFQNGSSNNESREFPQILQQSALPSSQEIASHQKSYMNNRRGSSSGQDLILAESGVRKSAAVPALVLSQPTTTLLTRQSTQTKLLTGFHGLQNMIKKKSQRKKKMVIQ